MREERWGSLKEREMVEEAELERELELKVVSVMAEVKLKSVSMSGK